MESSLLSVVIPVYNVDAYLPSCLDSVLNQSYSNIEIILIDDGSTDNSGGVCDLYALKDKRVKVIHISNSGVSVARNLGLKLSKGQWITFIDADDLLPQDSFLHSIQIAERENLDIVMALMHFELDPEGREVYVQEMSTMTKRFCGQCNKDKYILDTIKNFQMSFLGKVYKKTILNGVYFPQNIPNYEDFITLWIVAQKCPSYTIIKEIGYIVRCRPFSASRIVGGINVYRKRFKSLSYACIKIDEYFCNTASIRKYLTKFIINEGLSCRKIYHGFAKNDRNEVLELTNELWNLMKKTCIIPWYMQVLLTIRIKLMSVNINAFPLWQYIPIRLAFRFL